MTWQFNDEKVMGNLDSFMGESRKEYLPHGVTENEFLERLEPLELEKMQKDIAYSMIRRKSFNDARVMKKSQVIIDATEVSVISTSDFLSGNCSVRWAELTH